jgi:hypothetical protein
MSHVDPDGRFNDLKEVIHVDEKWFFVAEIDKKCYLLPMMKTPSTEPVSIKATPIKLCLMLLLQGQVEFHTQGNGGMERSTSCHSSNMSGHREALSTAQPAR